MSTITTIGRGYHRVGRRWRMTGFCVALMLTVAACSGGVSQGPTPGQFEGGKEVEALYEAAKKEGSVNLYAATPATDEIQAFVDEFETTYPGIEVNLTNKGGAAIFETFTSEKRAGRHNADVIESFGKSPFEQFRSEGLIERYTPTSASHYPEDSSIPDWAYPYFSTVTGALYNTDKVTEHEIELLRSYDGWTDPTWKGRVSSGSPSANSILMGLFQWVDQDPNLGEEWLRGFAANQPIAYTSVTPAAAAVISGDYAASFPQLAVTAARAARDGAPVGFAAQEYSVLAPSLVAVASQAPHPNAAKLLVEFHLSKTGQQAMIDTLMGVSVRDDMQSDPGFDGLIETPRRVTVVDEALYVDKSSDITRLWNEYVGPGSK